MKISFRPFFFSQKILDQYCQWFNNKRFLKVLYQGTPKTKNEVKAWIIGSAEDPSKRYFFVFKNKKLIGHIGLKNINFKLKHADVGSFFAESSHRKGKAMETALEFLVEKAKELGLQLLTADFVDQNQPQIKPFLKAGFTPGPQASHYLTLSI